MKRLSLLIIAIIFLVACSSDNENSVATSFSKKPKLPKLPKIQNSAQAGLKADLLGSANLAQDTKNEETDMNGLIDRINKNLEQRNITVEDMERGWYYGSEDERKWGTPNTWIWVNEGKNSHWISPTALEQASDLEMDALCRKTAGHYVISCVQRDLPHCEHIPKNECRCKDGTKWIEDQGCILVKSDGGFAEIDSKELNQGWYYGLNSEKKLNTPSSWIWLENSNQSRWQNPGAQ